MAAKANKGAKHEEMLRNYFLKSGYFVVRGVTFKYMGFDITDIDLWLYGRTSSVSREITIVDIKNKKTPQAIERIFWVNGLKSSMKANRAIVATTDRRKEVRDFGSNIDIVVLDGNFLAKLEKSGYCNTDRLTDEEFFQRISEYSLGKLDGDWKGRIIQSKSILASGISFDSCNLWLENAKFFAEQILIKPKKMEIAARCFYMIVSYIVLSVDFILKELSFIEEKEKQVSLIDGFMHGTKGKQGTDKLLNFTLSLVAQYSANGSSIAHEVRKNIEEQLSSLPSNILGEFFARNETAKTLFPTAKELEQLSALRQFKSHNNCSLELKSIIGVLLDYWGIDRISFNKCLEIA